MVGLPMNTSLPNFANGPVAPAVPGINLQTPWVKTPLVKSGALSRAAGCEVYLKLENFQPSGSFKSRGIGYYLMRRLSEMPIGSKPHIFASSGGNAGLAAVECARMWGLRCTVVVPTTTSLLMVDKLRSTGAYEVIQHGAAWKNADAYLREQLMPKVDGDTIYCPPFDHQDIWTGNSTVMYEIAQQLGEEPEAVICSVGGGGLLNGIYEAMDNLNMHTSAVVGVETKGAESLAAAMHAKQPVTLSKITSQATSLGCARVTDATFAYSQRDNFRRCVLTDGEAAMGCWRLADKEKMLVELACGVNIALCFEGRLDGVLCTPIAPEDKVVIVLCGGSNVTTSMIDDWRGRYSYLEEDCWKGIQIDSAVGSETSSIHEESSVPMILVDGAEVECPGYR